MKKTSKQQEREEARELYHNGGFSIEDLASRYGKSKRTIYRWLNKEYGDRLRGKNSENSTRQGRKKYPPEIFAYIKRLKQEVPQRSAPMIRKLLKRRYPNNTPSLSTIRRYLREEGLNYKRRYRRKGYVRFERSRANDLWQIDIAGVQTVAHLGPVYLIALLDDHSRYIVSATYFKNQKGWNVIKVIRDAVMAYGRPNQILADNGTQFRNLIGKLGTKYSRLLESLGIKPIFAKPYHPETKGKLERWFGTVKQMFLAEARRTIKHKPRSNLTDLNQMLTEWVHWYNTEKPHRSLPDQSPPVKRFMNTNTRIFRPLKVAVNWKRWLHEVVQRKVSKYNEISYKTQKLKNVTKSLQIPPGFAGTKVDIIEYEDKIEIYHQEQLIESHAYKVSIRMKPQKRKITHAGLIMYKGTPYSIDYKLAGKTVEVHEINQGKNLLVYLNNVLIKTLDL